MCLYTVLHAMGFLKKKKKSFTHSNDHIPNQIFPRKWFNAPLNTIRKKLAASVPAVEIFQRSLRELGADMELQTISDNLFNRPKIFSTGFMLARSALRNIK